MSTATLTHLAQQLAAGASTAFAMIHHGQLTFHWGDLAQVSSIASVRKGLISLLYGIAVDEGRIDLRLTLTELGIDDIDPLTPAERRATIADLLTARSGVYHPSVYDTDAGRPPRGSHPPGTHFFYNNWDFNALGTIYQQLTGVPVPEALHARLAVPLGMEDYTASDGHLLAGPESRHPVYKLRMSARDFARVGLLVLRHGRWGDRQIVPEEWVRLSTRAHADLGGGRGFGYLWWSADANAPGDSMSVDTPIIYSSGARGQYIVILPALDLVVVHRSASGEWGITHDRMGELLRLGLSALG